MDDMRIQMLIEKLISIYNHGSPSPTCLRFPPSLTPRIHHTSVLDSPVLPAPVHELSKIFSAASIQSTADDESATTPDIRSR
jgi:hypothetical protein